MPKVRVADVLKIESSGISDEQYHFALTSHFDFVVTDDHLMPLFAVEFDGPSHSSDEQRRRDSLKNKLCESFKLPLLRVNGRYLERKYRGLDLLTWFIEVWFIERMLYQAQKDGRFPEDEPVMASLAYSISGYDNRFPLWLSCEPLARIRQLHEEGKCRGRTPSVIVSVDENGTYRAISWLRVTAQEGILIRTSMRAQQFPIVLSEALEEITSFQIHEALLQYLSGDAELVPVATIDSAIRNFHGKYEFLASSIASERPA